MTSPLVSACRAAEPAGCTALMTTLSPFTPGGVVGLRTMRQQAPVGRTDYFVNPFTKCACPVYDRSQLIPTVGRSRLLPGGLANGAMQGDDAEGQVLPSHLGPP